MRIERGTGYEVTADRTVLIHAADATVTIVTVAPGMWMAVEMEEQPDAAPA